MKLFKANPPRKSDTHKTGLGKTTKFIRNGQTGKTRAELTQEIREANVDKRKRTVNHNDTTDQRHRAKNAKNARSELN